MERCWAWEGGKKPFTKFLKGRSASNIISQLALTSWQKCIQAKVRKVKQFSAHPDRQRHVGGSCSVKRKFPLTFFFCPQDPGEIYAGEINKWFKKCMNIPQVQSPPAMMSYLWLLPLRNISVPRSHTELERPPAELHKEKQIWRESSLMGRRVEKWFR